MIKKLKATLLSMSALFMLAVPAVAGVSTAYAADTLTQTDINNNLCKGANLDLSATAANCQNAQQSGSTLTKLIKTVINIISILVGAIAVLMIIFGGFRYVTSGGNDSNVSSAKNTILYALIGLVIVALAQIVVHFVLNGLNQATSS